MFRSDLKGKVSRHEVELLTFGGHKYDIGAKTCALFHVLFLVLFLLCILATPEVRMPIYRNVCKI